MALQRPHLTVVFICSAVARSHDTMNADDDATP